MSDRVILRSSGLAERRGIRRRGLFAAIGRLHEDAGRLDEAVRSYEAALALESNSQSGKAYVVGPQTP